MLALHRIFAIFAVLDVISSQSYASRSENSRARNEKRHASVPLSNMCHLRDLSLWPIENTPEPRQFYLMAGTELSKVPAECLSHSASDRVIDHQENDSAYYCDEDAWYVQTAFDVILGK